MRTTLRDVMTRNPIILRARDTVRSAALAMSENGIGTVLVEENGSFGIVTDRDLVLRCVAEDRDPASTPLGDVCTHELCMLESDAFIDDAVELMRARSVRRIVIVEEAQPVGVVSLGDLAMDRDPGSALAAISAAPAQH